MFYNINFSWMAIVLAAVAAFIFGWLWHALCGKAMMKMTKMTESDKKKMNKNMGTSLFVMFIGQIVTAYVLAVLMSLVFVASPGQAVELAVLSGIGFTLSTTILGGVLWEKKPWGMFWFGGAFWILDFVVTALALFYL